MNLVFDMLFDDHTSYGVIANNFVSSLRKQGVEGMVLAPWPGSNWFAPAIRDLPVVSRTSDFTPQCRTVCMSGSDGAGLAYYNLVADTPPSLGNLERLKNCRYLIVPSQGTKDFYVKEYSFGNNLRVVHRGSDFKWARRSNLSFYTFLYVGYLTAVKGVDLICQAFMKAFTPEIKDVRLILKGNDPKSPGMPPPEYDCLKPIQGDERVKVIESNWPHSWLESLFWGSDAFVYPYRVVGFSGGKVSIEARSTGCIPIVPKIGDALLWGEEKYLLDCEVVKSKPPLRYQKRYGFDGQWGMSQYVLKIEVNEIAAKMRAAYENRPRLEALEGWTWDDAAKEFMEVVNEV